MPQRAARSPARAGRGLAVSRITPSRKNDQGVGGPDGGLFTERPERVSRAGVSLPTAGRPLGLLWCGRGRCSSVGLDAAGRGTWPRLSQTTKQPTPTTPAGPLMTLAEAAEATGRPVEALRAILRRDLAKPPERQRLRPRKGNRGEWLVELPAGLRQAARPPGRPAAGRHDTEADDFAGRLADLEQTVAGRVADLESALAEARIAAATAAAERNAAKAAATLEAGLLREQLGRELARVADLERQLAEARRPFWSRWFGKR